jgi:multicomponent Na+:H+ antiporter subunit B
MTTVILRTATRPLAALLLVFAIFVLLRGHDHPGGGFIGGLVAGGALSLYAMVYGAVDGRRALMVNPRVLVAGGLLLGVGAGLASLFRARGYLTHYFVELDVPLVGDLPLSTTLVFDIGVFFVVAGMVTMVLFRLLEDD